VLREPRADPAVRAVERRERDARYRRRQRERHVYERIEQTHPGRGILDQHDRDRRARDDVDRRGDDRRAEAQPERR